jgi:uncharacterized membrane protein YeaQ/YmgE (transglycosylase-associated protein family)
MSPGHCSKISVLGTAGNSICGILGGGLGGAILNYLGVNANPDGGFDLMSILGSAASGGVGGGVVLAIIGFIKSAMGKK